MRRRSQCGTPVPVSFWEFELKITLAGATFLSLVVLALVTCAWLHAQDRVDWIPPRRNMDAYFTPWLPARTRTLLVTWRRILAAAVQKWKFTSRSMLSVSGFAHHAGLRNACRTGRSDLFLVIGCLPRDAKCRERVGRIPTSERHWTPTENIISKKTRKIKNDKK